MASPSRDLGDASPVTIHAGAFRTNLSSRNHAELVSIDGERLIEGGHDSWAGTDGTPG